MRPVDTTGLQAAPAWSEAELVELTIRLAADAKVANPPARIANQPALAPAPAAAGPLTGRVSDQGEGVPGMSTAPVDQPWSVPLLVTSEVEAWLLGWPAGLVTPAHDHGRATVALTVVEGSLSEECLDPTIWTTGRRTTWGAGTSTLFPPGHVHLLGPAGDAPAVAVHAWSGQAGSGGRGAGRLALARGGAGGRGPGRGRGPADPVGVGGGRGGDGCLAGHPAHRALDLEHVRDRVAG
jgi:quercetin dioxygenase-like cupin family protein